MCFVCGREEQSHGENSDVGASNRRRRKLFLLDGDRVGGPVDTGVSVEEGGDVLDGDALEWVRGWIAKAEGRTEVALMALVDRRADLA